MIWKPWQFILAGLAGWMNRQQQHVIEYLREENRIPPTDKVRDLDSIPAEFRKVFDPPGNVDAAAMRAPAKVPPKHKPNPPARITINACAFDRGNARIYADPDEHADFGPLAGGPEGADKVFVEYDIDIPVSGQYELHVKYSAAVLTRFNRSCENSIGEGLVNYRDSPYGQSGYRAVPPLTHGSHRSSLVGWIRTDPRRPNLTREEFIKIVTWIDANVPYYGTRRGEKSIAARDVPDFRPLPLPWKK